MLGSRQITPLAAGARPISIEVRVTKTEEGLGFNVMGGKEQNSPIYISRIIPGKKYIKR